MGASICRQVVNGLLWVLALGVCLAGVAGSIGCMVLWEWCRIDKRGPVSLAFSMIFLFFVVVVFVTTRRQNRPK